MKKFKFSLEKVLNYKEQIEDSLKNEHAQILSQIRKQEEYLKTLETDYTESSLKLDKEKTDGCTVNVIYIYEGYLKSLISKIKRTKEVIAELNIKEQKKLSEVLNAKMEKSSIGVIKDKRVQQYNSEMLKAEELFIEEFVSNVALSKKIN